MKKLLCFTLLLLVLGVMVYAENSSMFVVTKHITKIYIHRLGFRVLYLKNDLTLGEFYVPMEWFDRIDEETNVRKGVIIRGIDSSYPYFSIYWSDGEFHSIKLHTQLSFAHETWGNLRHEPGIEERFNIETIELDL